mgnify:CR=1 FL=1
MAQARRQHAIHGNQQTGHDALRLAQGPSGHQLTADGAVVGSGIRRRLGARAKGSGPIHACGLQAVGIPVFEQSLFTERHRDEFRMALRIASMRAGLLPIPIPAVEAHAELVQERVGDGGIAP